MALRVSCSHGFRAGALILLILLAGAAPAQQASPDAVLARIRSHMAENLRNLPNYVCVETIERSRRPLRASNLVATDRLKLEVAHVGERELYAWPGAAELGKLDLGTLAGGGMIGSGAFALRARVLFLGNDAVFHFAGREKSKGRELLRYDFRIPASGKHFMLANNGAAGFVGEFGSFWADAESLDIVRLRSEAGEIPPDIGLKSSFNEVEYRRSPIAGSEFLLPTRAEIRLAARGGGESRNVTTFSSCHKYRVESTLSFDLPAEDQPAAQPRPGAAPLVLPAGLDLSIELRTPIDSRKLITGDPLEGRLTADVVKDGKLLVPAGALVRGRLRRLELLPDYGNALAVAVDFQALEFGGQTATFSAEIQSFQKLSGISDVVQGRLWTPGAGNWVPDIVHAPAIPGVATLFLSGHSNVPAGFGMVWRTTAPANANQRATEPRP